MFRTLGILVTVVFAIGSAVLTWPQFFRVEQTFPIAQLIAVRGLLVLGYAIIALIALALLIAKPLRGFAASMLAVAVLAGAIMGGQMLIRGVSAGSLPEQTPDSLRVMTWNTEGEAVPAPVIADVILAHGADIVALPETAESVGEQIAIALRERGHPMWVHHVNIRPDVDNGPQAWQTTLLISVDLGDYSVIESSLDGSSNTGAVPSAVAMPIEGEGPIVVAVHAIAPRQGAMAAWRDDLRWIADQCPDENVILAGDFNATLDHLGGFGVDGADAGYCIDAAARTGTGATGTWPASVPALLGSPIDHIMASRHWTPTGSLVLGEAAGSDHRALIVQLEPVP